MDWMAVAIGVTSGLALGAASFAMGVLFGRIQHGDRTLTDHDLELVKQAVWFDVPLRAGDGPSHTPAYFLTRR